MCGRRGIPIIIQLVNRILNFNLQDRLDETENDYDEDDDCDTEDDLLYEGDAFPGFGDDIFDTVSVIKYGVFIQKKQRKHLKF